MNNLQITNSLSNKKEIFTPINPKKISLYVCGPTVYDVPHLGHARTALTYDTLKRYLEWDGYDVVLVSNITDIDDKIINRASDEGITESQLSETATGDAIHSANDQNYFGINETRSCLRNNR